MSVFLERIHQLGNAISFVKIREIANESINNLPRWEQDRLYEELLRGTKVLEDELHMNMYLRSFGNMHKAKMDEAVKQLPQPEKLFSEEIEIIDWGCGQGIATICLLDALRTKKIPLRIKRITLVEPSTVAIIRAKEILLCYSECQNVEIRAVIKGFDELVEDDVKTSKCRKLHLFSNILDVTAFDLAAFTQLFQKTQKGGNYIVCVGPLNKDHKRIEWFVEAINPEHRFVNMDRAKGEWIAGREWTISLHIVAKYIEAVEEIEVIRKRIEKVQRNRQFFAGYVSDAVNETLANSEHASQAEQLMASLSTFNVKSDKPLDTRSDINPLWAVMNNIVSRGIPTRAPLIVEDAILNAFDYSFLKESDAVIRYCRTKKCNEKDIFEALHLIDPRFTDCIYNKSILDSSFEEDFLTTCLTKRNKTYITQVLEPQRLLSSIVDVPNRQFTKDKRNYEFTKDQRVDFALEVPYSSDEERTHIGFVVEVNGQPYHSSIMSKLKDARRDTLIQKQQWDTYSLSSVGGADFTDSWEKDKPYSQYLSILKKNFDRKIESEWADLLQFTLTPFAVARIEKMLIEALIDEHLEINADCWKIAVIERDVPCAALAIKDFQKLYTHLTALKGENVALPRIELTIISTKEFANSPLHGKNRPRLDQQISTMFDLCIDISMLLRSKVDSLPITLQSSTYYVIRSCHYSEGSRTIYTAESIAYQPLVEKTSRGEYRDLPNRREILEYFLQNIFRKKKFLEGQLPILSRALSNRTTIGLLPTGGGKSLTYQLAAILQPGVTIVVDPLISLMTDQYEGLYNQRFDVVANINSTQSREEKAFQIGRLQNGELQFMFLSPERFMMEDFRECLLNMSRRNKVYFAYGVIDEVHTVSEWGHDFRPAYLHLGRNMMRFLETKEGTDISIIGLTATASFDVLADVERELTLGGQLQLDSDAIVRPEMSEREELTYHIEEVHADCSQFRLKNEPYIVSLNEWGFRDQVSKAKRSELEILLRRIPSDISSINSRINGLSHIADYNADVFYTNNTNGYFNNAGIIFCPIRKGLDGIYDQEICDRKGRVIRVKTGISTFVIALSPDFRVGTFMGNQEGDEELQKRHMENMKLFINNLLNIMVATKAFGMGIDKPNVRFSINYTHPSSIESYVQEAGRAGRDKKVAISYLLFESTDYVDLSLEHLADVFSPQNVTTCWLYPFKDHYVLWNELDNLCQQHNLTFQQTQLLKDRLKDHRTNVDKNVQLFFHNNSFRGSYKERIILAEMAYNIMNVANAVQANDGAGIYARLNNLQNGEYAYVVVTWENEYKSDYNKFHNLVIQEANRIAATNGWSQLPPAVVGNLILSKIDSFQKLILKISELTNDESWRIYYRSLIHSDLEKAFCKRRDKDDTDKAIYRMCCIGLVEDVTIDYNAHYYILKVVKKPDNAFFDCLQSFFEKYYSAEQASQKVIEAKKHRGNNAIDKCLGYMADFVYENLEVKRRRAIDDMQDACRGGIQNGDKWLKDFIHLYFNSKYARDRHDVNGQNYSLKLDIRTPNIGLLNKYINAMNQDSSGTEVDNVKHLYGATLIILRAQAQDAPANAILYLLRSYCLAFLHVGNNGTLSDEFIEGYKSKGFDMLIEQFDVKPDEMKIAIDMYNTAILGLKDGLEPQIRDFILSYQTELNLKVIDKGYKLFTNKYTN